MFWEAICILSGLQVNGDRCFFEYFAAMGCGKAVTDKEKKVIIRESAKGISLDVITKITERHNDSVKRLLHDLSPRKKRSDATHSKTVTDRDMSNNASHLLRSPG